MVLLLFGERKKNPIAAAVLCIKAILRCCWTDHLFLLLGLLLCCGIPKVVICVQSNNTA
jgi:hypothetical protein